MTNVSENWIYFWLLYISDFIIVTCTKYVPESFLYFVIELYKLHIVLGGYLKIKALKIRLVHCNKTDSSLKGLNSVETIFKCSRASHITIQFYSLKNLLNRCHIKQNVLFGCCHKMVYTACWTRTTREAKFWHFILSISITNNTSSQE